MFYFSFSYSQSWTVLNAGLDRSVNVLYADSVTNKLYVGGEFTEADNIPSNFISVWDGNNWDSLAGGMHGGGPVFSIKRYNQHIYAGGYFRNSFSNGTGKITNGFAKWNGSYWDSVGIGFHSSGGLLQMVENNGILYMVGSFDSVGFILSQSVVAYDGSDFLPIGIDGNYGSGGSASACLFYNNELHIGGNFQDSTASIHNFAKRNNNQWINLCSAMGCGFIDAMAIYNGELYFSGIYFTGPGQHIMKFDGSNFSSVGGDLDWRAWKLKVFNNLLFAVGGFNNAGGQQASKIAYWDGVAWSNFTNDIFDGDITDIEVFNGDLYVAGGFTHINNINFNRIARYPNFIQNIQGVIANKIKIYPNPVNDQLLIQSSHIKMEKIKINDVLGKEIYSKQISETTYQLDVSFLKGGLYFLIIKTKDGRVVKKFVKE